MTKTITWRLANVGRVDSTQRVADEMARSGAPQGQVVAATEQLMGRGRFDRSWSSPEGGLYMSLVLRPSKNDELGLLPLLGAFSVVEGITKTVRIVSLVRWPNDVTIAGKKVAGVIAESKYNGTGLSYVIVGIGINCNFESISLGSLAMSSTTLRDEVGAPVEVGALRDATLESLASMYDDWEEGRAARVFADRKGWFSTTGKTVEVEMLGGKGRILGRAQEVMDDGSLVVIRDNGSRMTIRGEEIQRLRELQ